MLTGNTITESATKRSSLPLELAKKLSSLRTNQSKRESSDRKPLRLADADIKAFKMLMRAESTGSGNLWEAFLNQYIDDKLFAAWDDVVEAFGLNFLSLRQEDKDSFISIPPEWDQTVKLMSEEGLSSSDAMIVNMFYSSKFEGLLSSDADLGIAVSNRKVGDKICVLPDQILENLMDL